MENANFLNVWLYQAVIGKISVADTNLLTTGADLEQAIDICGWQKVVYQINLPPFSLRTF